MACDLFHENVLENSSCEMSTIFLQVSISNDKK